MKQTPIYRVQTATSNISVSSTNHILEQFAAVFQGLGKLKAAPIKLYQNKGVKPPQQIPYHFQEQFNTSIQEMESEGVTEDHTGPVTWISNPVLVAKPDGTLQITVDLHQVNKAIENTHLPIPHGMIYYPCSPETILQQVEFMHRLSPTRTCRGIMGSLPISGELNSLLRPISATIPNAEIIHDDIVIASENHEAHNKTLFKVLSMLQDAGLTLNKKKCIFATNSIPFWQLTIMQEGLKPDPEKCEALTLAKQPSTNDELISFFCMVHDKKTCMIQLDQYPFPRVPKHQTSIQPIRFAP